jgi:alkyl sulfatase BDS1-like metallo-beta-lactamase superfamily hydrolase
MVRAMSTENWLDFIGISIDPRKAEGLHFTINLVTPDNGEKHLVELSNATLTNIKGEQAKNPDLTITLNRADLNLVMMGRSTFDDLIKAGKAKFTGDRKPFDQLRSLIVVFRPNLEILPGTAARANAAPAVEPDPFSLPDIMPPDEAGD